MIDDSTVELIKAIGTAVSGVIGAVGLVYARLSAKRSKQTVAQTTTTQHINGQLTTRTSAESAEQALFITNQLVDQVRDMREEIGLIPGNGRRRAPLPEDHHETV